MIIRGVDRPTLYEQNLKLKISMAAFAENKITLEEAGKIMKGITTLDKILWYKRSNFWEKILIGLGIEKYEE
jgi:hypothetical protein